VGKGKVKEVTEHLAYFIRAEPTVDEMFARLREGK
jgi:hypothetical protein